MRVLVIGATGFIGPHIVSRLVEQGHDVAALHRGKTLANLPDGVFRILGDRNRLDDLRADLVSFAPDVVVDAIPYTERQARGLVQAFRGKADRIVAISSADVYRNYDGFRGNTTAGPDLVPLTEDAPCRATRYPYRGSDVSFEYAHDYEKILVEQVLRNEPDLPAAVLRLPAVYGPGDRQHRLRPYVRRMVDGRHGIILQKEQAVWRWTRGFVVNVAAAVALAVMDDRSARRVYNVGEEPALTERQWVERIGAAAGWQGTMVGVLRERMPDHLKQPYDWRYELWTDTNRIRKELAYVEPVHLDEALKRTVEWERSTLDETKMPNYGEEDALLQTMLNE